MFKYTLLLGLAVAASARKCKDITVDVSLSSRQAVFSISPPANDIDATNFFLNVAKQGGNYTDDVLKGYATVKGNYKLATTYCEPSSGPGKVLQIMTHGIGFDRSYWDLDYEDYKYSFVARALDDGYSTLTWDRLGVGQSSKGDAVNEIQANLEVAALKELTDRMAEGTLCGPRTKYSKIVHVGHSFGSVISYTLTSWYPHISAGIALTGFSQVPNYLAEFALGGNFVPVKDVPSLANKYPKGYFGAGSKSGVHINFFAPDNFDPKVLDLAYQTGQPFSVGELLTVGGGTGSPSPFKGPALVITGERDTPFCGGNCLGTSAISDSAPNLLEVSAQFLNQATPFNATVVPKSGHGLNLEKSHPFTYSTILDFFNAHV